MQKKINKKTKLEQRKKVEQRKNLEQRINKKSRIKTGGGSVKIFNQIQKRNILVYTSFIFITNVLTSLYKGYYLYSFLFACLTVTSVLFHSNGGKILFIVDKIPIVGIVSYGAYMLYQKSENKFVEVLFIVTTFLLTIFLYYYGYCTDQYCYHIDKNIGDNYHALLHCICSIGHHSIILL